MTRAAETWCCELFREAFEKAGERGICVLVESYGGQPLFLLQFRAIRLGDAGPPKRDTPIGLISEAAIQFCPWCGRNLRDAYAHRAADMRRPGLAISLTGNP